MTRLLLQSIAPFTGLALWPQRPDTG
jgi:hypothetical protein